MLLPEGLMAAAAALAACLFSSNFALMTEIVVMALFVLSLSLVLGQGGMPTLGHAVFFGTGAYAAGLFAMRLNADPLLGLLVGGVVAGLLALLTGLVLLRTRGLTFLMLTIAVAQIAYEIANTATSITGGDDGLSGISVGPIFGAIAFDFSGRTAFIYAVTVLVIVFFVMRKLTQSPFGATLRGIRSDPRRMQALGSSVYKEQLIAYCIGGLVAGLAGALSAQTAQVVGMSSLSFTTSGDAMVMLVVGGSRRLPGAIVGTVLFMLVHYYAAAINPYHWQFLVGALLIVCVLYLPEGVWGLVEAGRTRVSNRGGRSHAA
ncbi:branched-chain amino acid ABC transporter permease [Pararobbsia silviterrae]|uniref:Branched-chain amino acid ABC transporter permease n=2 Tax=Pararobbsia silviterrae TaxID=1792498 RepID=A0A494XV38_9BURK|nr:branched-chain amino acid ABC transporter permease [Pararobbsia silviterrae]